MAKKKSGAGKLSEADRAALKQKITKYLDENHKDKNAKLNIAACAKAVGTSPITFKKYAQEAGYQAGSKQGSSSGTSDNSITVPAWFKKLWAVKDIKNAILEFGESKKKEGKIAAAAAELVAAQKKLDALKSGG